MAHVEKQISVPRSGAAVYAYLADLDNMPTWIPAIRRLDLVHGTAGAVGAEYDAAVAVGGTTREGRLEIVSLDPPSGMRARIHATPLRIDAVVSIEDHGEDSELSVALDAPTGGLLRLMEGPITQALRETLDRLPQIAASIPEG
ncbi:SRPBCC family protein [Pseudolysinimonas sp.]|uniref:SRPBCC family protein n=1 Tax=Pseudolysinimonas sp. TaxID=2680009 RepID=UPI003F7E97D3